MTHGSFESHLASSTRTPRNSISSIPRSCAAAVTYFVRPETRNVVLFLSTFVGGFLRVYSFRISGTSCPSCHRHRSLWTFLKGRRVASNTGNTIFIRAHRMNKRIAGISTGAMLRNCRGEASETSANFLAVSGHAKILHSPRRDEVMYEPYEIPGVPEITLLHTWTL